MAPGPPTAGNAEPTWLNAGAAEVQPSGTDNTPSEAARPTPAVTEPPPMPGELMAPVPGPPPGLSVYPNAWNPLPTALLAEPNELVEPNIEMPEVAIDADEAVPDTRLVPDVSAVDADVRVKVDSVDVEVVDEATADASPSTALGAVTDASGVVTAESSGDTVCTLVPAEVAATCVTAAASPVNPPGSVVVCSGGVNGVNVDAVDDAPA